MAFEPFAGQKRWYVIQTNSGYENAVKNDLELRIDSMGMTDYIFNVLAPEETIVTTTKKADGTEQIKKKVKQKFPGYVFVEMIMTDESWFVVRNTPRVTGLLGSSGQGTKPVPLEQDEVNKILSLSGSKEKVETFDYLLNKEVAVVKGPLKGQRGKVSAVDNEQKTAVIIIELFGRGTESSVSIQDLKLIG